MSALRAAARGVHRQMKVAQQTHHDIEPPEWMTGVLVPLSSYVLLWGTGAAFMAGYSVAFTALAIATVAVLLNGVFGAWELLVWMAVARTEKGN